MRQSSISRTVSWVIVSLLVVWAPLAAEDASGLAERAAAWAAEFNAGNFEAVAAMYAPDAERIPPNAEAIKGRDAILDYLRASAEMGASQVEIGVTEVESHGDTAWARGTYSLSDADGGHLDHGEWMSISKNIDGEWLTHRDIWNSSMPLPDMDE